MFNWEPHMHLQRSDSQGILPYISYIGIAAMKVGFLSTLVYDSAWKSENFGLEQGIIYLELFNLLKKLLN